METDLVFKALADPNRRALLDMLHEVSGLTLGRLCEGLDMRRQSVSQHLRVLEEAGLVTSMRDGRRKLHYLNPVPIHQIQRRWIWKFEEPRLTALDTIKQQAEARAMTTQTNPSTRPVPDYVYTTYIRATPEDVWEALTDPELTAQFWGHRQISDWSIGSTVDHVRTDGSGIADASGRVIAFDRPHRLVFGFDDPQRFDDPTFEPSVVTFEIQSHLDIVQLTVTHSQIRTMEEYNGCSQGWPAVLSNLKTLLETGEVLPQEPWKFHADERPAQVAENA